MQDANFGAIGRDLTALKVDSGTSFPDQANAGLISDNTWNLSGLNQVHIWKVLIKCWNIAEPRNFRQGTLLVCRFYILQCFYGKLLWKASLVVEMLQSSSLGNSYGGT